MPAPHPAELVEAVRQYAAQGLNDREIGDKLSRSKDSVEKIRRVNAIPPGKVIIIAPDTLEKVRSLALRGSTDSEIGRAVGMTRVAVEATRRRHGIQAGNPPVYHRHGTPSMYNAGCRCEPCKNRHSNRMRLLRHQRLERLEARGGEFEHGTSGYVSWGCRCDTCAKAQAKNNHAYYNSSQAVTLPQARNNGKQWTGPELELASRDDLTANEVAAILGRTFAAVHATRKRIKKDPKYVDLAGVARGSDDAHTTHPGKETST